MKKKQTDLNDLLLKIGTIFHVDKDKTSNGLPKQDILRSDIRRLTTQAIRHPDLTQYKLEHEDILIIAAGWYQYIADRDIYIDPLELLATIYDKKNIIQEMDHLVTLLKKNIFYSRKKRIISKDQSLATEIQYYKYVLLENDIFFHHSFTRLLMNEAENVHLNIDKPYRSNREFVADWISYVSQLSEFSSHNFADRRFDSEMEEGAANDYLKALLWKERIDQRLRKTNEIFPLLDLVDEYQLDHNETIIIMYLVKEELYNSVTSSDEIVDLISKDQHEKYANKRYIAPDSPLVRNGLIELQDNFFFLSRGSEVRISPDITRQIIMSTPINDDERLTQMVKGDPLFTLLDPMQGFHELILPQEMKRTIKISLSQYHHHVEQTLAGWGLFNGETRPVSANINTEPGLLMLFYGPPGTGKTYAAGAIARELNKKLLITDISRIQCKWVGESEKNVRRLFAIFERIVRRTENPPVLLLNEADQFLSRRVETLNSSVDVMYNSMQNIFLEAFERLKGIMIATTNLKTNLDVAFSRRFHLKLEFPLPGRCERKALWKLHLPETIPGAREINIDLLARSYSLTGGQISIIVKNAATEAAARRGKKQKLTFEDLIKYCEIEHNSMFDIQVGKMGFDLG